MKLYKVSYWSEGPGYSQSGVRDVLVLAKNKKDAIKTTIRECGVYKVDQPEVRAEDYKTKSMVIKHLEGERD